MNSENNRQKEPTLSGKWPHQNITDKQHYKTSIKTTLITKLYALFNQECIVYRYIKTSSPYGHIHVYHMRA